MNGNSSNTSQNNPSFDAFLGDSTGLTPYGIGSGDANPFDADYALSPSLAQHNSGGAGPYPFDNNASGAVPFNHGFTPPGGSSPHIGLTIEQQQQLAQYGSFVPTVGALPNYEMPMSQSQMHELQRFANANQQFNELRARPHMADGPSFNPAAADSATTMAGLPVNDTIAIQANKPFAHLDLLRRGSSEQSNESSNSTSPKPTNSTSRKLNTKIAARRGGSSTLDTKRVIKAETSAPSPKMRRRSTAASASSAALSAFSSGNEAEDESKRAEFLERNRIAASKCRHKKKEWTNNLEAAARQASQQSRELQAIVAELQSELIHYQNELLAHQHCDNCHIQQYMSQLGSRSNVGSLTGPGHGNGFNGAYHQQ